MSYLANLLTCLSLACGFFSIIFSLEQQFTLAAWAIILSVVFDGLDGQIARLCAISSDFGKELDSLVDVVSFGIAPTILGYIFVYRDFHIWAALALFAYLMSSIWRLAKYNITPKDKLVNYFIGLPTTVSGGVIASFILIYRRYIMLPSQLIFLFLVIILAFLMVSQVRYLNLDGIKQLFSGIGKFIFLISVIVLLLIFRLQVTMFIFFIMYLILAPFLCKKIEQS